MTDFTDLESKALDLYNELLTAQHTSDAIGKALRLPYRAIPLQPIADMKELVGKLFEEVRSLRLKLQRYEARGQ